MVEKKIGTFRTLGRFAKNSVKSLLQSDGEIVNYKNPKTIREEARRAVLDKFDEDKENSIERHKSVVSNKLYEFLLICIILTFVFLCIVLLVS
ncbi:hypothetical protein [Weissella kandleri]|uniref:hypothetical protein n=1 Tax=Weissella kandleri TaxID=1616 RepID=UPI00070D1D81|nr:hypothetical protein [Weissella kandleri]